MHMKLIVLFAVLGVAFSSSPFLWLKAKHHLREIKESDINLNDLPTSLDWRTKGVISPVMNQGQTGNPAAFAVVEVIESLNAIKTGKLVAGSVARVIDCCPQPNDPFQCISKLGGLCAEASYPAPTGKCVPNQCEPSLKFDTVKHLKNKNESTMVTWIQDSPLFAGLDASRSSFLEYRSGIYSDPGCSKQTIDHALQIVGYGEASGVPYWICKNSWGTNWGEQGYIRILRGSDTCGIAVYVSQVA